MAIKTYTLWYRGSDSTTSATSKSAVFPFRPTYINEDVIANIPPYSLISQAIVAIEVKRNGSSSSTYNTDIYWTIRNSSDEKLSEFGSQDKVVTTSYKEFSYDYTSYFKSGTSDAGLINSSLCDHLGFCCTGTLSRTYTGRYRRIEYTFVTPTYNISLTSGTGGTVSGAGTYEVGTTATIKATPNSGYRFVKWSDGNTSATRTITKTTSDISANVTNLSYTAIFEPIIYVSYDSIFSFKRWADTNLVSWDLINISSVTDIGFTGTAIVDDAYTLECRPLIPVTIGKTYTFECDTSGGSFEFFIFNCNSSGAWADFTYGNTKKFNFTASTDYVSIRCDVVGTGTVVNFSNFRLYPADCPYMSNSVTPAERTDKGSWSMPTPTREGYKFKGWNTKPDGTGTTYTSSSTFPSDSLVLYSQWEVDKINELYIGTAQPKGIYTDGKNIVFVVDGTVSPAESIFDTVDGYHIKVQNTVPSGMVEATEFYIGTTKVYG